MARIFRDRPILGDGRTGGTKIAVNVERDVQVARVGQGVGARDSTTARFGAFSPSGAPPPHDRNVTRERLRQPRNSDGLPRPTTALCHGAAAAALRLWRCTGCNTNACCGRQGSLRQRRYIIVARGGLKWAICSLGAGAADRLNARSPLSDLPFSPLKFEPWLIAPTHDSVVCDTSGSKTAACSRSPSTR